VNEDLILDHEASMQSFNATDSQRIQSMLRCVQQGDLLGSMAGPDPWVAAHSLQTIGADDRGFLPRIPRI